MENTTAFDLNNAIGRWRDGLSQAPQFREEDLAELESHLRDSVTELQARGLTSEEAFLLAARRLGNPASLEPEFAKVNRGQVWLHRLLWMLVGIQVWGLVTSFSRVAADAAVIGGLAGFGSSFPQAYPFSTGGVLAAALFGLVQLLALAGCVTGCWWLVRRKENAVHYAVVKALRRPVVLGLVVTVILLVISLIPTAIYPLMHKLYSPEVIGRVALAKTIGWLILSPLQTLAFVVLTIVLLRRRVRLSPAA
jgi:hypothetical protein